MTGTDKEGGRVTVLTRLEQQAEEATNKAARLNRMVEIARELGEDGLSELAEWISAESVAATTNGNGHVNGNGNGVVASGSPRGRKAVRIIVRKRPGIWTYQELRAEMQQREWFTTDSGLEAAAKRLCDSGEGRRLSKGQYVFPANHGEEDIDEMFADGVRDVALIATAQ